MDHILFHRLARAIEREAAIRGYQGDIFTKAEDVPLVGTYQQQMDIASIGCDVSLGPMSTRERALLNRLVRAVVLTDKPGEHFNPRRRTAIDHRAKLAREWSRGPKR